jgi:hypothetical protein
VKQLRRLKVEAPADAYRKAQRCPLRNLELLSEGQCHALERDRPGLVVIEDDAVLVGWPGSGAINLQYGFPHHIAFVNLFGAMLERLLRAVDPAEAPIGVCVRLTERTARSFVEPALAAQAFELVREWMKMTLDELPAESSQTDELAQGFRLRPAVVEDAEVIAELDAMLFLIPSLTPTVAREQIERAPLLRILEDASDMRPIGYLQLGTRDRHGYISELVVHPDYQRRGLGEAMMRWALA